VSSLFSASGIGSSSASKIRSPRPTPPQDSATNGRSVAIALLAPERPGDAWVLRDVTFQVRLGG